MKDKIVFICLVASILFLAIFSYSQNREIKLINDKLDLQESDNSVVWKANVEDAEDVGIISQGYGLSGYYDINVTVKDILQILIQQRKRLGQLEDILKYRWVDKDTKTVEAHYEKLKGG